MAQANFADEGRPYAIVIGLDSVTGLQTARILAGNKVPVIAIAKDPSHSFCRTKVCRKVFFADTSSFEFIESLLALGPELDRKAVLFPCSDSTVLMISRRRSELERWYHVVLPEAEVVETLMDKISFFAFARDAGLPIPSTYLVSNRSELEAAAANLTFPCIVKPPMRTPTWEAYSRAKVIKASSREDLMSVYERCSRGADVLMVQEWIEGTDAELYSCNCYFDADSKPLVTFISRKLRQWPPETGVSCLAEECRNDLVLTQSIRLFQSVNYRGLGYVEMKRDVRSGKYFIIEPNIGRPTGRSAIAEAGHVPLLYAAYCDVAGEPLPSDCEQKYGKAKWIYFSRDVRSAIHYWRQGSLSLKGWLQSWRGLRHDAVYAWADPGPFFGDVLRCANILSRKIKSGPLMRPFNRPKMLTE